MLAILTRGSNLQLHEDIEAAVKTRRNAACSFNEVTDPDLIDAAIHEYQAADKRLNYLLRQAKKAIAQEG